MHSEMNRPSLNFDVKSMGPRSVDCFFVEQRMSEAADDLTPEWIKTEMKQHYATCKACTEKARDIEALRKILLRYGPQPFNPELVSQWFSELKEKDTESSRLMRRVFPRQVWIAAEVIGGIVLIAVLMFSLPHLRTYLSSWTGTSRIVGHSGKALMQPHVPDIDDATLGMLFFTKAGELALSNAVDIEAHQELSVSAEMLEMEQQTSVGQTNAPVVSQFTSWVIHVEGQKPEKADRLMKSILEQFQCEQAGKTPLGSNLNGGLYYHFLINASQVDALREQFRSRGSFSEQTKPSTIAIPKDKARIALWVHLSTAE